MKIQLDEGYFFGLGAFETIAVHGGRPVFLKEHLERLGQALEYLGIAQSVTREEVYRRLESDPNFREQGALKILVSGENKLFLPRENPYTEQMRARGFLMDLAGIRRNERSTLTYYKTMNYGDCILEKRRAKAKGLDEAVFLNSRGEICEGTVSNIFFVRAGQIFTPERSCGLLPGIFRRYVLENWEVREERIFAEDVKRFEECFLTNSLMGVMPAAGFGRHRFEKRETAEQVFKRYEREVLGKI